MVESRKERDTVNVAFCVNERYAKQVRVVVNSVVRNHPDLEICFYIFTSDMKEGTFAELRRMECGRCRFELIRVVDDRLSKLKLTIGYITAETYFRYVIADLLPDVDKLLYLDADVVVNGNLLPFYSLDLNGFYLAAVADSFVESKGDHRRLGLDRYFNAGVLLMNLQTLRQDMVSKKLIAKTNELEGKIDFQDQDVLNVVCSTKTLFAKAMYNFTSRYMKRRWWLRPWAVILHYTGERKPWSSRCRGDSIWHKYEE